MKDELILWLAQGFNVGRIPLAPGLFGSIVGLLWLAILLVPESRWFFLAGIVFGFFLSVWICGQAERILGKTDPSSVVLDEIVAIPVCFLPWVWTEHLRSGAVPPIESFFTRQTWMLTLMLFLLFRVFDVLKPWPIRPSQRLPGGWGVTVDDFLAAACVAVLSIFCLR